MGKNKAEQEELKKLEDEAYFELCQIIAEAVQLQDINLLDQRINYWKKKYIKLLDSSNGSASANFKKRIEFLLNQYYSEITQYILKQIKLKEEKKIENQSKALRKLYRIIKDTNDLKILKKKVKEWEGEYPISSFLKMYQKRIKIYTSDKNLESNAFDQDKAFYDLYSITKLNRTFDEFKKEISDWEDKYSIHDKFELDDFIKHQTEVKRYASDEYLKSIAKVEEQAEHIQNEEIIIIPDKENSCDTSEKDYSSLPKQTAAYTSLMSIARKNNNIDEMFKWVYKNSSIRFNDKYKELILNSIYLDYSPSYLNSLSAPKINFSASMSLEDYQNIDELKRYAIISYFNLLLPPEKAMPNSFFNNYVETIYHKSKSKPNDLNNNQIDSMLQTGVEISLSPEPKIDIESDLSETLTKQDATSIEIDIAQLDDDIVDTISSSISDKTESSYKKTEEDTSTHELPEASNLEKNRDIDNSTIEIKKVVDIISSEIGNTQEQNTKISSTKLDISKEEPKIKEEKAPDEQQNEHIDFSEYKSSQKETISSDTTKEITIEPVAIIHKNDNSSMPTNEQNSEKAEANIQEAPKGEESLNTQVVETSTSSTIQEDKPILEISTLSEPLEEKNDYAISEPITYDTVVALSPQFFHMMNFYNDQAVLVGKIDNDVNRYMSLEDKPDRPIVKTRDNNIN